MKKNKQSSWQRLRGPGGLKKLLRSKRLRSKPVLVCMVVVIAAAGIGFHYAGTSSAYGEVWNATLVADSESYPTVTNNNGDGYIYNNTRSSGTTWDFIYMGTVCGHGCAWPFS